MQTSCSEAHWRKASCSMVRKCRSPATHRVYECNFATRSAAHYRSKHITRYRQSSRSPATRRVYTSMFRSPQWHGAAQTHFPPRPSKSAWRCDITNVISPHGPPRAIEANISHDTTNHPAHQRHAAFTPACFALPHFPPRPCKSAGCRRGFESRFESAKRVFRMRLPPKVTHIQSPKRAFRTRRPPKVTLRVCKTSLEHFVRAFRTRLPQKLTCQSLRNKRFVQDFLQKSSGNTHRSTHVKQPCQAVLQFQPLQTTPAHTPIPMSP